MTRFDSITNEKIVIRDRYPSLKVTLDGQTTLIPIEQKPTLINNGIVFLGDVFEGKTSVQFEGMTFDGFTDDPNLFALYQRFRRARPENNFNGFVVERFVNTTAEENYM